MHLAFGVNHVIALDKMSAVYSFGDGSKGCLGHGDEKKRFQPSLISFFTNKRVIDVSCGDSFSVIIAEVEGDPNERGAYTFGDDGKLDKKQQNIQSSLVFDMNKAILDQSIVKANRIQICGSIDVSLEVMEKVKRVVAKNL